VDAWAAKQSDKSARPGEFTRIYAKRCTLKSTSGGDHRPIEPTDGGVDHYVHVAVRRSPYAAAIMALLLGWLFGRFGERNQRTGRTS
jgi:hypothetical protein